MSPKGAGETKAAVLKRGRIEQCARGRVAMSKLSVSSSWKNGCAQASRVDSAPRTGLILLPSVSLVEQRYSGNRTGPVIPDLRVLLFEGARLQRGRNGTPQFNFTQVVWLYKGVPMDWSVRMSREVETLAANILFRFLPRRGRYASLASNCLMGRFSREEGLAWQFASQVLVTLPHEGSELHPDVLRGWVDLHLRILWAQRSRDEHEVTTSTERSRRGPWMRRGEVLD